MADWLTAEDVELFIGSAKFLQYLDEDNDNEADEELVEMLLDQSMKLVEGYVGARYEIPTANPPGSLVLLGCLAFQRLCRERRSETYTDAERGGDTGFMRNLQEIQAGKAVLAGMTAKTEYAAGGERASDAEPVFNRQSDGSDPLAGW